MFRVMFVCLGNICRSPLGHAIFQQLIDDDPDLKRRIFVESSGTGAWHVGEQADARMRKTARRRGTRIDHPAQQFTREHLEEYDLVIAMDGSNRRNIERLAFGDEALLAKVHLMREFEPSGASQEGVPDPYYGGDGGFDVVYDIVFRCSEELLRRIRDGEFGAI